MPRKYDAVEQLHQMESLKASALFDVRDKVRPPEHDE